jgi:hypothetical protein
MLIGLSVFTIQSCDNKKEDATEKKVVNVPAPVQTAFSAKYSTATDVKWEDAHEGTKDTYKAKFMLDGKKWKAEFDANGGFVKEEEDN